MDPTVRAASLTNFFEVARERGLNPLPLLRQVGLSRALLDDPDQRIPAHAAIALLERAAIACGDDLFGLRMARSRQMADMGVASLVIAQQPTLRDALRALIDYRHLVNQSLALDMEDAGSLVIVRQDLVARMPARQSTELANGVLFRMCSAVLGEDWRPDSVNFTHAAPRDTSLHKRFYGCRLEFASDFNGLVCHARDLDRPNPAAAPALARYAQRFVDSVQPGGPASLAQEVRKVIFLMLASGRASSAYVAQSLGMSVRTLQRRLEDEGQSFGSLLDEVRRELAQRHMDNPRHSLARVSQLLGYSAPSAFTRWFSSAFGMAPQRWRQQRTDGPGSP